MKIQACGMTSVGCVRSHNEDAHLVDPAMGVFAVCDGVGGHAAGEVASQLACDMLHAGLKAERRTIDAYGRSPTLAHRSRAVEAVRRVVQDAGQAVFDAAQSTRGQRGMAATVALLVLTGESAVIAHAGDSRVYLVRGGEGHLLTEDHSYIAEQFRKGLITAAEVGRSPASGALTRALGIQPAVEVETLTLEVTHGDRFLLCSDGLSDLVVTSEIVRELGDRAPTDAPKKLIELAHRRGGHDNITAVAVDLMIDSPRPGLTIERRMDALRCICLFEHLSFLDLTKIMNLVTVESFAAGRRIIAEGETGRKMFVCMAGSVEVVKNGQTLTELEAGSFFGEMALIDNAPRSADVFAKTEVKALTLTREDFHRLIRREPHLAVRLLWALAQVMNGRLRHTSAELSWARSQRPEPMSPEVAALFEMSRPDRV